MNCNSFVNSNKMVALTEVNFINRKLEEFYDPKALAKMTSDVL